jgi:hypothetical protein
MKNLLFIFFTLYINVSYATNDHWVNATGSGETYDEAKNNALRNALEMTFGAFVSSNSVINNDILQKDEIISISSGNVKKIIEISRSVINDKYCIVLSVLVSPDRLASFVSSKGMIVDYQGEAFASNIKLQILNEKSEIQAIQTLATYAKLIYPQCFDYSLKVNDPYQYMDDAWEIKMELNVKSNQNFDNLYDHIIKTLGAISLNNEDFETRKKIGKYPYIIEFKKSVDTQELLSQLSEKQKKEFEKNDKKIKALEIESASLYRNYYTRREAEAVENKIQELRSMNKKIFPYNHVWDENVIHNDFKLRSNESRIILRNLFGEVLLKSLGNVKILMDAGSYSRDIKFSYFKLNTITIGSNDSYHSLYGDRYTKVTFEKINESRDFALFSYVELFKGQHAVDVISKINGFKVIKKL